MKALILTKDEYTETEALVRLIRELEANEWSRSSNITQNARLDLVDLIENALADQENRSVNHVG